jgi:hypothetical protein
MLAPSARGSRGDFGDRRAHCFRLRRKVPPRDHTRTARYRARSVGVAPRPRTRRAGHSFAGRGAIGYLHALQSVAARLDDVGVALISDRRSTTRKGPESASVGRRREPLNGSRPRDAPWAALALDAHALDHYNRAVSARIAPVRSIAADDLENGSPLSFGAIVGVDEDGGVLVSLDGNTTVRATLAMGADRARLEQAMRQGEMAVLVALTNEGTRSHLLIGIVKPPARHRHWEGGDEALIRADVDGRRLHIQAQDEIVLQCGEASVTLRRNGKIIIKGIQIETAAAGTHRIKGGQVRIN